MFGVCFADASEFLSQHDKHLNNIDTEKRVCTSDDRLGTCKSHSHGHLLRGAVCTTAGSDVSTYIELFASSIIKLERFLDAEGN